MAIVGDAPLGLLNMGPLEIVLIAVAAVIFFGGDLPTALRKAGRALSKLRNAAADITRVVYDAADEEPPAPRLPPPPASETASAPVSASETGPDATYGPSQPTAPDAGSEGAGGSKGENENGSTQEAEQPDREGGPAR